MFVLVTQRRAVAFGQLLQLVGVGQDEESPLETAHLLHLGHHILIDTIHDLLQEGGRKETEKRKRDTEREREIQREKERYRERERERERESTGNRERKRGRTER